MSSKNTTKTTSGGAPSAAEENAAKYPDMSLGQRVHRLEDPVALLKEIAGIENVHLYRYVLSKLKDKKVDVPTTNVLSEADLQSLINKHKERLVEMEQDVKTAAENAGDMEVLEARLAIARYAAQCLDPTEAIAAYRKVLDLPKLSSGKQMDAWMEMARIAFFYKLQGTTTSPDHYIAQAEKLSERGGGDWDRRNRLKVYRSLAKLWQRDMAGAAPLLLDGMATFSCNELCTYSDFLIYAMLANLLHLDRPVVHEKILQGPEVMAVQHEIPIVVSLCCSEIGVYMDLESYNLDLVCSEYCSHTMFIFILLSVCAYYRIMLSDQIGQIVV